jgi:hypothetical protein
MVTGSVTLTRDELYVFLALLGLRPVNALPQDMAAGITDDEAAIRFNCGELTLHERGLLTYAAEQRPVLHDFLIALVGTAALPEATLLLQRSQPDGTSTAHIFSRRPGLLVEHSSPRAGIFSFALLEDGAEFANRVQAITEPLVTASPPINKAAGTCYQVDADSVTDFLNRNQIGDRAGAAAALARGGCPQSEANELAFELLTRPHWIVAGGHTIQQGRPAAGRGLLIVGGDEKYWLFEGEPANAERVLIHCLSGVQCRDRVLSFVQVVIDNESGQEGEDAQLAAELE